ncbi:MAG: sialidase family protein [Rubripirellula sp.]
MRTSKFSRRTMGSGLVTALVSPVVAMLGRSSVSLGQDVDAPADSVVAPTVRVHSTRVISRDDGYYCGWPTLTRRSNGQLLVVWSGGREQHVCPFGRVDFMKSDDEGKTWSWPRTLLDGAIDDRDAGVLETANGSLLVTTFTSLAYVDYELKKAIRQKDSEQGWPKDRLQNWLAVHERLNEKQRQDELGQWMIRSTDGGITWSERYPSIVNSPHGPIQLSDGRQLYAGVKLWDPSRTVGVCQSVDDGQSWTWLAEIPTRPGDDAKNYHELHAVEAGDGTIIVQIRNHNTADNRETLQCESKDGGKTWTIPHSIGVWGLPSHLLRLSDGRLLMSYGHRRKPFGIQARLSQDSGESWSEPLSIASDGVGGDLGYPSTVELSGGRLLTVWYERMKQSPKAVLRQAEWSIES